MAAGGGYGPQQSLRKAIGALKDSTKVGLVKVNSEFKDLDVAIVKATNHIEKLPKEKHVRTIFNAMSASRPQQDVNYCIDALTKRLAKTHNWAVALKTLLVIHRALREIGSSFCQELVAHSRSRSGLMMHLSHFKDDSTPNAWDYSAWVRTYALFLEERLECFRVLKYDVQKDQSTIVVEAWIFREIVYRNIRVISSKDMDAAFQRTKNLGTTDLLDQLPAMQQLLHRLLACQPEGAAAYNNLIQYALAMVASESVWIYVGITDGILNLIDKYFEMQRQVAIRALDIYKKASDQAEKLSEFFESCRGLAFGKGQKFVKIKQPPASFIISMEEYVKDVPQPLTIHLDEIKEQIAVTPRAGVLLDDFAFNFDEVGVEEPKQSDTRSKEVAKGELDAETATAAASREAVEVDLLCFDDLNEEAYEPDKKNSDSANAFSSTSEITNWELALVSASNYNEAVGSGSKLAGGLDKLTLDSLYDNAISQGTTHYMKQTAPNLFMDDAHDTYDLFQAPASVATPTNVQMGKEAMHLPQQDILAIQQQQPGGRDPYNQFLTPYSEQTPPSQPTNNPFSELI